MGIPCQHLSLADIYKGLWCLRKEPEKGGKTKRKEGKKQGGKQRSVVGRKLLLASRTYGAGILPRLLT